MRPMIVAVLVATAAALVAVAQTTIRPGQMTEARVWVENRGRSEALPVDLREVDLDRPLRVEVMNGDPALASRPVGVVRTRQLWEYKAIVMSPTADPAAVLNAEGAQGWETTGTALATQNGMRVILKRPR